MWKRQIIALILYEVRRTAICHNAEAENVFGAWATETRSWLGMGRLKQLILFNYTALCLVLFPCKEQWRTLVVAVMNIRVCKTCEEFLDNTKFLEAQW